MRNEFRVSGLSGYRVFPLSRFPAFLVSRDRDYTVSEGADRWVAPKARDFLGGGRPADSSGRELARKRDYLLS